MPGFSETFVVVEPAAIVSVAAGLDIWQTAALSLLEPAIIVVMGFIVAIIILAILLPILQLQTLVGG